MLKNDSDVLADLKALYLMASVTMSQEERKFYVLALLAIATQWGIESKFSSIVQRVEGGPASLGFRCQACSD